MNRFLADTLNFLNLILAFVIVAGFTLAAYRASSGSIPLTGLAALFGIVIAALVCGTIAYLALIERHLAILANGRSEMFSEPHRSYTRRDPVL